MVHISTSQRRSLLVALVVGALGTHLWHCRWWVGRGECHGGLLVIQWSISESEGVQKLRRAVDALNTYRETALSPAPAAESSEDLQVDWASRQQLAKPSIPPQASDTGPDWGAAIDRIQGRKEAAALAGFQVVLQHSSDMRSEAQLVATDMGIVDVDLAARQIEVVREVLRRQQLRQMNLKLNYPVMAARMPEIDFARMKQAVATSRDNWAGNWWAGLCEAGGVSRDEALLGGVAAPIGLIFLAWWLRLGWRQTFPPRDGETMSPPP